MGLILVLFIIHLLNLPISVMFKTKYVESLPITLFFIVLIQFVFGIFNSLHGGFLLVLFLVVLIHLFYLYKLCSCSNIITLSKESIFSYDNLVFGAVILVALYFVYGKMFNQWDEFSHWGDVVKMMSTLNILSTNPESSSLFMSYPPGMSIFQYFCQKINFIASKEIFCEWLVYFSFLFFCFSFIVSSFAYLKIDKIINKAIIGLSILVIPLVIFSDFYKSIYIDPVIGVVSAYCLITILSSETKDCLYFLKLCVGTFFLILLKDVGILFAIMILIIELLIEVKDKRINWMFVIPLLGLIIPKYLWNYSVSLNNVTNSFSSGYDLKVMLDIITGKDMTYRSQVITNYIGEFTNNKLLIIIILYVITLICTLILKKNNSRIGVVSSILLLFLTAYVVMMPFNYIFKFSEYEALKLASLKRYLGIFYLCVWIYDAFLILLVLNLKKDIKYLVVNVVFTLVLCVFTSNDILDCVKRTNVTKSISFRSKYSYLEKIIQENVGNGEEVYFISQGDTGLDLLIAKYCVRPKSISSELGYSLVVNNENMSNWDNCVTIEEISNALKNYDFLLLHNIDEDFRLNYGNLFDNSNEIESKSLYKVDHKTENLCLIR